MMPLHPTHNRREKILVVGPPKSGKALRNDQPVLTPEGWKEIGALQLGDFVYGTNGLPVKVMGVHPQGVVPLVEVSFRDTTIVASVDHLWLCQTKNERARQAWSIRTSTELEALLASPSQGLNQVWVPTIHSPISGTRRDLPIHPWLLGALIGDGNIRHGVGISKKDEGFLAKVDSFLPESIVRVAYGTKGIDWGLSVREELRNPGQNTNVLMNSLRDLGLMGSYSYEKSIPEEYLHSDVEARIHLLQGLMDSDGYASGSTCEWGSTSEKLADQVRFLVQSLGGVTTTKLKSPTYTYKGEKRNGRPYWRMVVSLPSEILPFTIPSKSSRYRPRAVKELDWRVQGIRETLPAEATCIEVDSEDHLFLTAGCIPTHNTLGAASIAYVAQRTKSPAHFYVIDTEDRWEATVSGMGLENYTRYDLWDYSDGPDMVQEIAAKAKDGDWVVFDKAGDIWSLAQEHYFDVVEGIDARGFIEKQILRGKRKWDVTKGVEWQLVYGYHDALIQPFILKCRAHLYMTASAKDLNLEGERNKGVRVMWGKSGVKPHSSPRLAYLAHSVLLMEEKVAGRFVMTSMLETGREKLQDAVIPEEWGFVKEYLTRVGGWSLS